MYSIATLDYGNENNDENQEDPERKMIKMRNTRFWRQITEHGIYRFAVFYAVCASILLFSLWK